MSDAAVRAWAAQEGIDLADGLIPADIVVAYLQRDRAETPAPASAPAAERVQQEASSAWAALRAQVADEQSPRKPAPRAAADRARREQEKAARSERARIAREADAAAKQAERDRLAAGKLERDRLVKENAATDRAARERAAAAKADQEHHAREQAAAAAKAVRDHLAARKSERARRGAEKTERERIAHEKDAADKAERERRAAEKSAADRLAREQASAEKAARKLAARIAKERASFEKAERTRAARAQAEAAKQAEIDCLAAERPSAETVIDLRTPAPIAPRVLLVDDEPSMRSWLRNQLEISGWAVSEAEDGPSALEMFDAARPKVVVLDEYMPRMRGLEVARELRARDDDVTLMLFSASVDPEVIAEADRLQIHFVSKINLDLLLHHLEQLQPQRTRAIPQQQA